MSLLGDQGGRGGARGGSSHKTLEFTRLLAQFTRLDQSWLLSPVSQALRGHQQAKHPNILILSYLENSSGQRVSQLASHPRLEGFQRGKLQSRRYFAEFRLSPGALSE